MRFVHGFMLVFTVAFLAVCAGCGDKEQAQEPAQEPARELEALGGAPLERKSAFAEAVARACARFDGLDGDDVKFSVTTNETRCVLNVSAAKMDWREFQKALSVAVTNLALDYPGLGFMRNEDGTWQILMPDDVRIPVSGGFGIDGK